MSENIVSGTAVTASGTSVDFNSIPAGVKRITVIFSGVSTNGASAIQVQIGAGSIATTGYTCYVSYAGGANQTSGATYTSGIVVDSNITLSAAALRQGTLIISSMTNNAWAMSGLNGMFRGSDYFNMIATGSITLAGALDRVRITTLNGTDTFDAGTINIMYE